MFEPFISVRFITTVFKVARAFQKKVIRSQPNLVENKIMMLQTCRDNKNDNRPTRFHFIKPHI